MFFAAVKVIINGVLFYTFKGNGISALQQLAQLFCEVIEGFGFLHSINTDECPLTTLWVVGILDVVVESVGAPRGMVVVVGAQVFALDILGMAAAGGLVYGIVQWFDDGLSAALVFCTTALVPFVVPLIVYFIYLVVMFTLDFYKAIVSIPRKLDEMKK